LERESSHGSFRVRPQKLHAWISTGLVGLMLLSGCSSKPAPEPPKSTQPAASTQDPAKFDWKKYSGTSLNVILSTNTWSDAIIPKIPEFEQKTGIKVNVEELPEQQARQKLTVQMAAGGTEIDAFMTAIHNERSIYSSAGWYQDLAPMLKNPAILVPEYDWNDHSEGSRSIVTQKDGKIIALPVQINPLILFYRKDLFEAKGLKPPTSLDELAADAKALNNPPTTYGFIGRGLKNANITSWVYLLWAEGGDYLDSTGRLRVDTPESVAASKLYAELMGKYGPPGSVNWNWQEALAAFSQGQGAMYYDGANFAASLEDPTKSKVAGKVGYMALPPGKRGARVPAGSEGMSISSGSKHKEAAFYFIEWATGKEMATIAQRAGAGTTRASAWADPEFKKLTKMPAEWQQASLDSLKSAEIMLPAIEPIQEFRDILGITLQQDIQGGDVQSSLEKTQKEIDALMAKYKK
jgi:multiple sugar transport system substrate-binding protein